MRAGHGAWRRAWQQMREDPWLQGVALTSLTVALAILGAYLNLYLNLQQAAQRASLGPGLILALPDQAPPAQAQALAQELGALTAVERVAVVDQSQALERLRQQLGPDQDLLAGLEGNPLPATVELRLRPGADVEVLAQSLRSRPEVAQVVTSRPWLRGLRQAQTTLTTLGLALGVLLFAGVVLLVTNTVRLAVHLRREQLVVLDLVGATGGYVRWPYVLEAMLQAVAAAVAASCLVWGLFRLLAAPAPLPLGLDLADLLAFSWRTGLVLAGLAAAAGALGGLWGVGRALRPRDLA